MSSPSAHPQHGAFARGSSRSLRWSIRPMLPSLTALLHERRSQGAAHRRSDPCVGVWPGLKPETTRPSTVHASERSSTMMASPESPRTEQSETITRRMFRKLERRLEEEGMEAPGAGGGTSYEDLRRLDGVWYDLRHREVYGPRPEFVRAILEDVESEPEFDVIVAGGTLGVFLAAALQRQGLKVVLVERAPSLKGRSQEWNISRKELYELVDMGVLSSEEAEECVSVEFNPVRASFHKGKEHWTHDVLNLGVSPLKLIETAKQRLLELGGEIREGSIATGLQIHPTTVKLSLKGTTHSDEETENCTSLSLTGKLFVDCMGNASPVIRQVRHGRKPDGVCLVVGTCARGFRSDGNTTGDVILTNAPAEPPTGHRSTSQAGLHNLQLFWEAFPAGSGPTDRTTYMFTYLDASPDRPSLEQLLEHYWIAMPEYQGVQLDDLEVLRILFGMFPTYRDSPVNFPFDRVIAIGDAGGLQSPLSFGGFAALMRHLKRLVVSISEAVDTGSLDSDSLRYIAPYNPALSGAWMLQRAMSIPASSAAYDRSFVNRLLSGNFDAMEQLDEKVLRTFLQDVIQAGPLARTLAVQVTKDPLFVPQILGHVGVGPLFDWMLHFLGLLTYTAAYNMAMALELENIATALPTKQQFLLKRAVERWRYGSGLDYDG